LINIYRRHFFKYTAEDAWRFIDALLAKMAAAPDPDSRLQAQSTLTVLSAMRGSRKGRAVEIGFVALFSLLDTFAALVPFAQVHRETACVGSGKTRRFLALRWLFWVIFLGQRGLVCTCSACAAHKDAWLSDAQLDALLVTDLPPAPPPSEEWSKDHAAEVARTIVRLVSRTDDLVLQMPEAFMPHDFEAPNEFGGLSPPTLIRYAGVLFYLVEHAGSNLSGLRDEDGNGVGLIVYYEQPPDRVPQEWERVFELIA